MHATNEFILSLADFLEGTVGAPPEFDPFDPDTGFVDHGDARESLYLVPEGQSRLVSLCGVRFLVTVQEVTQ